MPDSTTKDFRTEDMALVSVLRYFGYTPQSVEWHERKCYWYFMRTDSLVEQVELFMNRSIVVEPRQFNFLFGETKQEFYKLFDKNKSR